MVNFPAAVRRSQPRSSSRLSLARTFSPWRPATSMPGPLGGHHAGHRPAGLGRDRGDRIQQ